MTENKTMTLSAHDGLIASLAMSTATEADCSSVGVTAAADGGGGLLWMKDEELMTNELDEGAIKKNWRSDKEDS
uniref:Uncharacterized protein n=1 Tax=Kalanchoe fedtschenkoi TaxID=63787 RepID=A0A7N0UMZ0_KALFE